MEVVTPHVLTEDNKPKVNEIMLLTGIQDETVYYRPVLSSIMVSIENSVNNKNE